MRKKLLASLVFLLLAACSSPPKMSPAESALAGAAPVRTPDQLRINELERLLADKQRQCAEERRRQDISLKETQKKVDELQKKLDALLAIDRELRARPKGFR